jgi:hypothetical protein
MKAGESSSTEEPRAAVRSDTRIELAISTHLIHPKGGTMMSSKWNLVVAVSLLLLAVSVACGPSTPAVKVLPTPGVPANPFPTGSFAIGKWSLELKGDGGYALKADGLEENGTFAVSGDQVTLKGDRCAKLNVEKAVYQWNFDGRMLSFKALDDLCMDRLSRMDSNSWTKNP